MTFAITGCGHSGTKWLATQLAKAEGWTVEHEPDTSIALRWVQPRFNRSEFYGEVNSYLLTCFPRLRVNRKYLLLRDPYEIIRSVARSWQSERAVDYVREAISLIDVTLHCDKTILVTRLVDLSSSRLYVQSFAESLGLKIPLSYLSTDRVNHHEGADYPLHLSPIVVREFDDFKERYGV